MHGRIVGFLFAFPDVSAPQRAGAFFRLVYLTSFGNEEDENHIRNGAGILRTPGKGGTHYFITKWQTVLGFAARTRRNDAGCRDYTPMRKDQT
jgi:hypothetical protein